MDSLARQIRDANWEMGVAHHRGIRKTDTHYHHRFSYSAHTQYVCSRHCSSHRACTTRACMVKNQYHQYETDNCRFWKERARASSAQIHLALAPQALPQRTCSPRPFYRTRSRTSRQSLARTRASLCRIGCRLTGCCTGTQCPTRGRIRTVPKMTTEKATASRAQIHLALAPQALPKMTTEKARASSAQIHLARDRKQET